MKTEFRRIADQRLSGLVMPLPMVLRILMNTAAHSSARGGRCPGKVVFQ